MDQDYSKLYEDLTLLSDSLGDGTEEQWGHELRKRILKLLHQLKSVSRKTKNDELEAELIAVEVTLGYGSGEFKVPNSSLIEEHQYRLLELAELANIMPTLSPSVDDLENDIISDEDELEIEVIDIDLAVEPFEVFPEQSKIQLILCNCPGRDEARELARELVKSRLAACVNIISNIGAVYWWKGEIIDTAECQLQIKTSTGRLEDTLHYIKQNHSNSIPEILSIGVEKGNEDYFEWVKQETSDKKHD